MLPARAVLARPTSPSAGPLAVPSALQLVGNTPLIEIQRTRDGVAPAVRILGKHHDRYFKPDQYNNEANSLAHYETTGPEIWRQTEGAITHFVATIGTGGTIMGTGRYLKEQNRSIQVIAAEPADAFHGIEGLKHMASSIVPGIYHEAELDRKLGIETEDAYNMVYRLGRE